MQINVLINIILHINGERVYVYIFSKSTKNTESRGLVRNIFYQNEGIFLVSK